MVPSIRRDIVFLFLKVSLVTPGVNTELKVTLTPKSIQPLGYRCSKRRTPE